MCVCVTYILILYIIKYTYCIKFLNNSHKSTIHTFFVFCSEAILIALFLIIYILLYYFHAKRYFIVVHFSNFIHQKK